MMHWPAEDLWLALEPKLPGLSIEVLREIDSSSSELMRRARAGHAFPTLLVAEQQTAGRGRLGRPWASAVGDSLMFSLGLPLAPRQWAGLSLVVGLAVVQALQPQPARQPAQRLGLKWPNDLWLHDGRKLGGILIETANLPPGQAAPGTRHVVIGIGLNVRPPPARHGSTWSTPVASLQALDPRWTAQAALSAIAPVLLHQIQAFAEQGFAPFVPAFAQVDVLRGQPVHTSDGLHGIGQGVAPDGALLLATEQGLQAIHSNEVSVRPRAMPLPGTA